MRPYLLFLPLLCVGAVNAMSGAPVGGAGKPHAALSASPVAAANQPAPIERGTKEHPAVVDVATSSVLRVEAVDKTARPIDYHLPEWLVALFTFALASITAALAVYTYRLYRATVALGSEAKTSAEQQSQRMERSITEAGRAASAMEDVARATAANAKLMSELLRKQMRAYVSVDTGVAAYQDANLRFQALPQLTNYGLTPARNVRYKFCAAIIDGTGPADIDFPDIGPLTVSDVGISPRQSFTAQDATVDQRVPDEEVAAIMKGNTRRLFAWGKVIYDDVYGGSWETNFCGNYTFWKASDGEIKVTGYYYRRHNNAT